jgi:PAS domain S-box-containing protein
MSKARILLVEDEKVVAADIEECVKSLGYEVVGAAASGTQALRLSVQTEPDLVLMDIKLKGNLDGVQVAEALYTQLQIPVVYLTAHADAEILERAKKTAPSGYVLKPFDDRSLRTAIELAFERHHRERRLIESGQRLAVAIGSIDEAVIVTQENGRVALMNRMAETLTGWKQEEALGQPLAEVFTLLNGETGSLQPSPAARVFREGVSAGLGEHAILQARQGRRTRIQGSVTPVRDAGSEPVGVCLLFRSAGQRSRDENWGAPDHGAASRLEILGRLTAAVAQRFTGLLEAEGGHARAAELANRLLAFGQRQPAPPQALDLNALVIGLEDLLRCALGDGIQLVPALGPALRVKADPAELDLLLITLALAARDAASGGQFLVETSIAEGMDSEDRYAVLTVTQQGGGTGPAADLPVLDELAAQSQGEIRVTREGGVIRVYLPQA